MLRFGIRSCLGTRLRPRSGAPAADSECPSLLRASTRLSLEAAPSPAEPPRRCLRYPLQQMPLNDQASTAPKPSPCAQAPIPAPANTSEPSRGSGPAPAQSLEWSYPSGASLSAPWLPLPLSSVSPSAEVDRTFLTGGSFLHCGRWPPLHFRWQWRRDMAGRLCFAAAGHAARSQLKMLEAAST